jgi:hypothetical protein
MHKNANEEGLLLSESYETRLKFTLSPLEAMENLQSFEAVNMVLFYLPC